MEKSKKDINKTKEKTEPEPTIPDNDLKSMTNFEKKTEEDTVNYTEEKTEDTKNYTKAKGGDKIAKKTKDKSNSKEQK